jgi:hypothetical protein
VFVAELVAMLIVRVGRFRGNFIDISISLKEEISHVDVFLFSPGASKSEACFVWVSQVSITPEVSNHVFWKFVVRSITGSLELLSSFSVFILLNLPFSSVSTGLWLDSLLNFLDDNLVSWNLSWVSSTEISLLLKQTQWLFLVKLDE